jgi:Holliday junction resolvasome RuvABC endonuclease subunit
MEKAKKGVIKELNEVVCELKEVCVSDPKFVGLDLSYVATGLIVLDSNGEILEQKLINTDSKYDTEDRIIQIIDEILFIPKIMGLGGVCIEGPAYSSRGNQVLQMGALNFFVRIFLRRKNIKFRVVPPPTLKKWVAGNGRAAKEMMLLYVYKRWGVEFTDNNLADAYGLARIAMEDYENESDK